MGTPEGVAKKIYGFKSSLKKVLSQFTNTTSVVVITEIVVHCTSSPVRQGYVSGRKGGDIQTRKTGGMSGGTTSKNVPKFITTVCQQLTLRLPITEIPRYNGRNMPSNISTVDKNSKLPLQEVVTASSPMTAWGLKIDTKNITGDARCSSCPTRAGVELARQRVFGYILQTSTQTIYT